MTSTGGSANSTGGSANSTGGSANGTGGTAGAGGGANGTGGSANGTGGTAGAGGNGAGGMAGNGGMAGAGGSTNGTGGMAGNGAGGMAGNGAGGMAGNGGTGGTAGAGGPTPSAAILFDCDPSSQLLAAFAGKGCHPVTQIGPSYIRLSANTIATLYPTSDCSGSVSVTVTSDTNFCNQNFSDNSTTNDRVKSVLLTEP